MTDVILFQPSMGFYDSLVKSIPLGLLSISRYLDKEGYKIKIIDQRADNNWKKHLITELSKDPLCFGTTSTTGNQISNALEASKIVKEISDMKVVWGGPHPTILPRQTLLNKNIDIVIKGEGDYSFYSLAKSIEKRISLKKVKGICFKDNGKIINNPDSRLLDLNKLPPIPYHLVNVKEYSQFSYGNDILIETSRGCVNRCTFCFEPIFNKCRWRALSAEKVVENIKFVVDKFKINDIYFSDNNFFIDTKRVDRIINGIADEGLDIRWNCQTHVNLVSKYNDKGLLRIEQSGLKWLELGVESGSQKILNSVNKNITLKQVADLNKRLKKFRGIIPKYNFITGFTSETDEDLKKTTSLILKLLRDNPNAIIQALYSVTPYPGTEFYNLAVKKGFKAPDTLEGWINFDPRNWISNIPWLNKKQIKRLKLLFFSSIFIDNKLGVHKKSLPLSLFEKIYSPIGRFRFRSHSTKIPIELFLLDFYFYLRKKFQ